MSPWNDPQAMVNAGFDKMMRDKKVRDRLKEIEAKSTGHPNTDYSEMYLDENDKKYLIARVKRLTEALEWYESNGSFGYYPCESMPDDYEGKDLSSIARKALEEHD